MADKFWVGGTNTWDGTAGTKWSLTDGGAGGAAVPGVGDKVRFTALSGAVVVTNGAIQTVQGVDFDGFTGTFVHGAFNINCNTGDATTLRFSAAMTYTANATSNLWTFTHTTGTANITSNGKRLGGLTINGAGGSTVLLDPIRVDAALNSALTVTAGNFDADIHRVTAATFSSSNTNTRVISMGDDDWYVGARAANGGTIWNTGTATGLTFNKDSANLIVEAATSPGAMTFAFFAGQTFNDIIIEASPAINYRGLSTSGSPINANNVVIGGGNQMNLVSAGVLNCNDLTIDGAVGLPFITTLALNTTSFTMNVAGDLVIDWWVFNSNIIWNVTGSHSVTNTMGVGANNGIAWTYPGEAPLSAADIRAALGMSSANLDAQLAALPTANQNADALLDRANAVATGWSMRQVMRVLASALGGKSSKAGSVVTHRDIVDSKNVIVATIGGDGERTAVTLDGS